MQNIRLELADNGIIKIVEDDNINAAGEVYTSVTVYDFESSNATESKINFINDLILDSGLELGNSKDKNQIKISVDWGDEYQPSKTEIEERIKALKSDLKHFEEML
jgi:hypothetical protein